MSEILDQAPSWAASLAQQVVALGGRASLVLLAAFLVCALMRRSSAGARHLVWTATLTGLLLLPLLAAVGPSIALPLLPRSESGEIDGRRTVVESRPVTGAREAASTGAPRRPAEPRVTEPGSVASAIGGLAALYLLGVLATLAYLAAGLTAARRLTRAARPLPDGGGLAESSLRSDSPARLLISRELRAPVTWGLLDPVVLLPAGAAGWSAAELRCALLHELAHVERRDWAAAMLARLACCLLWFHPLVWLAARRQALEAERACDDRVLAAGAESSDYAGQLLSLVRSLRAAHGYPAAVAMAGRSQLERRIESILDPERRREPMKRIIRPIVFALACLPAVLASVVTLVPAAAEGAPPVAASEERDLIRAAAEGDRDRLEELIAAGADVNRATDEARERLGRLRTPLATAARAGHLEIVRALLEAGAEVDRAPAGDATALIEAAGHGHRDVVALLLDWRANPDLAIPGDGTPLIAAARSGDREIAELLLAAGADPNRAVNGDGDPLGNASSAGHVAVVETLVAAGADPNQRVRGDGSPLLNAAARGDETAIEALLAGGADVNAAVAGDGNALIAAARAGHLGAVRRLLDAGAEIDRVVPGDENALIQAAAAGHVEVVRYLIRRGADVNVRVLANGSEWRTPLSQARRGGHTEVVDLLRGSGARE